MTGICPNCKRTYGEGIRYCLECGTPLVELKPSEPEKQAEPDVSKATIQASVEKLSEDVKPSPEEAPRVDVETGLPSQPAEETIPPILEEINTRIRSLEASLKVVADTNMLILKKIYELDSKLDAIKSR